MPRIKKVSFNEVHIDDKIFRDTDIFLNNDAVEKAARTHNLTIDYLDKMMLYEPECIIIGNGFNSKVVVSEEIINAAKRNNIEIHSLPTPEAVKKIRKILRSKRVSAFLHMSD